MTVNQLNRVETFENGQWVEQGHSKDFGNAWEYARMMRREGKRVRILGPAVTPEGMCYEHCWEIR